MFGCTNKKKQTLDDSWLLFMLNFITDTREHDCDDDTLAAMVILLKKSAIKDCVVSSINKIYNFEITAKEYIHRFIMTHFSLRRYVQRCEIYFIKCHPSVYGFIGYKGICLNLNARENIPLNCNVAKSLYCVIFLHELSHFVRRYRERNANYSSPTKNGFNEAGTHMEINLFGEEIDLISACTVKTDIMDEWINEFLTVAESDESDLVYPKYDGFIMKTFKSHSVNFCFKKGIHGHKFI